MKILSQAESAEWLSSRGFDFSIVDSVSHPGWVDMPKLEYIRVYETPTEARNQMVLAHQLTEWITGSDVLLWFSAWPFHKDEEETIFREFREFWGERRSLEDAPGYAFTFANASDAYMCANLLCFMMAFDWEAFVMRGDQQSILRMDDGIIWTVTRDPEKDGQTDQIFDALGVFERDLDSLPDIPAFGRFWSRSPRPENRAEHAE